MIRFPDDDDDDDDDDDEDDGTRFINTEKVQRMRVYILYKYILVYYIIKKI